MIKTKKKITVISIIKVKVSIVLVWPWSDGRLFLKAFKFGAFTVSLARLFHSRIVLGKNEYMW